MKYHHDITRSSMISAIDYDSDTKVLKITFVKGSAKYEYQEVPKQVYDDMLASESVGKYFLANVKDRYITTKL